MIYLIIFMILAVPVIPLVEVLNFEEWFLTLYSISMSIMALSALLIWEYHKERIKNLEDEVERLKEKENK